MTLTEKMQRLASLDRAKEYAATQDKFIYALDTLRHELDMVLPLSSDRTDEIVEQFENMLEDAQRDHCTECDCILTSHESEYLCRSCEERIAHERSFYNKWQSIYDNDEQDLH